MLFITSFSFPDYDAGATRTAMLGRALLNRGCDVELCGVGDAGVFDGMVCHTLNSHRSNRVLNWLAYRLLGGNAASFVHRNLHRFDAVVASFLPSDATARIKRMCQGAGIAFAVDCTEWYTPEEFPGGENDPSYRDHVKLLTEVVDSNVKVIAISSFLERYFVGKGCCVLRVPSVLDIAALEPKRPFEPSPNKVEIMYAGSPAKKDSLDIVLNAIGFLGEDELKMLSFDFYGVRDDDLLGYMPEGSALPTCVRAHGRVPRAEVVSALGRSDFTVLMRDPDKRFAQAGMPTKVTESLGCGTPVIANITSDLGNYLEDGNDAIVVGEYSAEACAKALKRAAGLSVAERVAMRADSRSSAWASLDYRVYADVLDVFLLGAAE